MQSQQSSAHADNVTAPVRPTHPFCQATGFVYQIVGFVLAVGSCCWWSFSGRLGEDVRSTEPSRQVIDVFKDATAAQWWGMLAVCLSFVGGLGLIAVGIGLQYDMSRAGRGAKWTTGAIAMFFWTHLGFAAISFPRAATIITTGLMAIGWSVLFLLAGASSEELRMNPPVTRDSSWSQRDEDDLRKTSSPRPPGGTSR